MKVFCLFTHCYWWKGLIYYKTLMKLVIVLHMTPNPVSQESMAEIIMKGDTFEWGQVSV